MKDEWKDRLWFAVRILVGLVFAYAGFSKLIEPSANFEAALLKYGVFSPRYIPLIARTTPWLEWIFGSLLIVGYAPRVTGTAISLLSLGFLVTLSSSGLFLESGGTDCGCFGRAWIHLTIRQIFFVDLVSFVCGVRLATMKKLAWSLDAFLLK